MKKIITIDCLIPHLGARGLFFIVLLFSYCHLHAMVHPGDSIISVHTSVPPVIDGNGNDVCWNNATWVDINYMWMPYNTTILTSDFSGKYKVMWNKTTNLLYFLVEITDDKFVNGYVYSKSNGSYPNFDVLEVFIDDDRPGGDHAMTNAAYAYHITGGNSTTDFDAIDIFDPTNSYNWGAGIYVNSKSHLPEFKRTNIGTKYTWEFSLKVLTSAYKPTDNSDLFKAILADGKKMGLTLAYCDNDNSAINPVRDNFIASKYETDANKDISWQNSTTFAHLTLKEYIVNGIESIEDRSASVWIDTLKQLHFKSDESWKTPKLTLIDISGRIINSQSINNEKTLDFSSFSDGFYFVVIEENNRKFSQKFIL